MLLLLELEIVDLTLFYFILNLRLEFSMTSHVTVTKLSHIGHISCKTL